METGSPNQENGYKVTFSEPQPAQATEVEKLALVEDEEDVTEQISSLLSARRGNVVQIDYIVRKLYRVIDGEELKGLLEETKALLELGEKEKLWFKMPDSPGCWTIDLKEFPDLVEDNSSVEISEDEEDDNEEFFPTSVLSEKLGISTSWLLDLAKRFSDELIENQHYYTNASGNYFWSSEAIEIFKSLRGREQKKYTKASQIPLKKPYQNLRRIKAIENILTSKKGEMLHIDHLFSLLYGNLSAQDARVARDGLTKILSKGKQDGLWERVPGKIGYYRAKKN